jgi:thiamine-phosphate pyrophosphorylase
VASAVASGADAVLLSPILAARKGRAALGLTALAEARSALVRRGRGAPRLYALGGVEAGTARACLEAGADGVAVIGAALDGRDARPLLQALGVLRAAQDRRGPA